MTTTHNTPPHAGDVNARQMIRPRRRAVLLQRLDRRIEAFDIEISEADGVPATVTADAAPALVGLFGIGPTVAHQLLTAAGDDPQRLRSEAAFAKLAGVCPVSGIIRQNEPARSQPQRRSRCQQCAVSHSARAHAVSPIHLRLRQTTHPARQNQAPRLSASSVTSPVKYLP